MVTSIRTSWTVEAAAVIAACPGCRVTITRAAQKRGEPGWYYLFEVAGEGVAAEDRKVMTGQPSTLVVQRYAAVWAKLSEEVRKLDAAPGVARKEVSA